MRNKIVIAAALMLTSGGAIYAADRGDSSTGGGTEMSTGDMAGSKHPRWLALWRWRLVLVARRPLPGSLSNQ